MLGLRPLFVLHKVSSVVIRLLNTYFSLGGRTDLKVVVIVNLYHQTAELHTELYCSRWRCQRTGPYQYIPSFLRYSEKHAFMRLFHCVSHYIKSLHGCFAHCKTVTTCLKLNVENYFRWRKCFRVTYASLILKRRSVFNRNKRRISSAKQIVNEVSNSAV